LARLVHESPIVAIGLGEIAEGVAQTRESYAEAISALSIGPLLSPASPLHDFQELAPLIALLEQPQRARRFATSALEPLGDLSRRSWLLPTLEAYLLHQGRLKQAAADLGVHINTIKYRLKDIRSIADPSLTDATRANTLLLALRILRLLDADPTGWTGTNRRTPTKEEPES
ncbi:MAG: helix-turn-helix domain-containing protein, partial [Actinobacteria bacterium]|nr:helix-turn-helix domain-containing protein [Actinomycetota bacterium]